MNSAAFLIQKGRAMEILSRLFSILVIVIIITITIVYYICDKDNKIRAKRIIDESGYLADCNDFMFTVFKSSQSYQNISASSNIVSNFATSKWYDYLVKYFGMKINTDSIQAINEFTQITQRLFTLINNEGLKYKYIRTYLLTFTMSYTSPAGRKFRSATVTLDNQRLQLLQTKVSELADKQNFAKHQRKRMTAKLRKEILERDNYTCQVCGNSIYNEPNLLLEVDHIVPVSKGGETTAANLQTLCWKCNRNKSNKL